MKIFGWRISISSVALVIVALLVIVSLWSQYVTYIVTSLPGSDHKISNRELGLGSSINNRAVLTIFTILRDELTKDSVKNSTIDGTNALWFESLHTINAIGNWLQLPGINVILFGATSACEFVRSHVVNGGNALCLPVPCVHPEFDIPTYDCLYETAFNLSTTEYTMYSNSDMLYFDDIIKAVEFVGSHHEDFLMVGQRLDIFYPHVIPANEPGAYEKFRNYAMPRAKLHGVHGLDYFLYRTSKPPKMRPFLVGRVLWDNWLLANAIKSRETAAIDATQAVTAIHLNHMKIGNSATRIGTEYNKGLVEDEHVHPKKIGDIESTDFALLPKDESKFRGECPKCRLARKEQKLDVVLFKAEKDRNIIVATVNEGYLDFAINWLCALRRLGLHNYLFHAADVATKEKLQAMGEPVFFYQSEESSKYAVEEGGAKSFLYGSVAYQSLMNTRTEFIYKILQKGYNILLCDIDVILLRNPFLFMDPTLDIQGGAHKEEKITGGFVYFRATQNAFQVWTRVLHQHREMFRNIQNEEKFDIHAMTEQELLNKNLLSSTPDKVKWGRIPQQHLADGKRFFIDKETQKKGEWPMGIHNNFIIGKDNKMQRFQNISMWLVNPDLQCRMFPLVEVAPPSSNKFSLVIKLLAYDRPASLKRLMRSLFNANYDGDKDIQLDIMIDSPEGPAADTKDRKDVIALAYSFRWPYGKKRVIVRDQHYGLAGQWLNAWFPVSDSELGLFLEDDNVVSPDYYIWIKEMAKRYYFDKENYDPRLYGFALQNQHMIPGKYPTKPADLLDSGVYYYRYQQLSTWGPIFFPNHWAEFLSWHKDRSDDPNFFPLFSNLITNKWFLERGGGRSVWSAWFIRFTSERGWYCIYTNFPEQRALIVNYRDKGVNYPESKGPNSSMQESIKSIPFPKSSSLMPLYDFHFNLIAEDPSILEDRGLYSDIYNIQTI